MGFNTSVPEEKVLWQSKKHFLTLPWSFTFYKVTEDRVFIQQGLIKTTYNETRLYRVTDIRLSQNFIQKLCGTSTVELTTRDKDFPVIYIQNVFQGYEVKELISGLVEQSRKRNRVITTDH